MADARIIRRDPTGWRVASPLSDDDDARFERLEQAIAFCRALGARYEVDDAPTPSGAAIGGEGRDVMPDAVRDPRGER